MGKPSIIPLLDSNEHLHTKITPWGIQLIFTDQKIDVRISSRFLSTVYAIYKFFHQIPPGKFLTKALPNWE